MSTAIRRCEPSDLDTLRALARQTYDGTFRPLNTAATMDAYLEAAFSRDKLEAELRNPCSEFFFLVVDGTIAGYMKLNEGEAQTDLRDPQGLEVERIYVKSGFLGRGLGKVLLRAAEHRARQKGKTFLWLGVWEKNTGALGFYRHMGFRKVSTHDFSMGDERQTDYVMRKEAEQP